MFTRSYWQSRDFPLFFEEDDGKNPPASNPDPKPVDPPAKKESSDPDPETPAPFTKAQQAIIDSLVGTARKEGRESAEQAANAAKQADEDKKAQEALEAKGEYDKAKTGYETTIEGLRGEIKAKDDLIGRYEELAKGRVEAVGKELELPAEWMEGFPKDGAPIDQLAWYEERAKLWNSAKPATDENGKSKVRTPSTPVIPENSTKPDAEEIKRRKELAARQAKKNW